MVYRFTIISDEVDNFRREIQIDSEATFLDFHNAILKSVGYPNDQMTVAPIPVFLPGESHGQRALGSCRPWARTELDGTEHAHTGSQTVTPSDW